VILLGIILRLYHLDHQSLWGDEISSIYNCRVGLIKLVEDLINWRFGDVHPPFYYFLVFFWMKLFGETSLATRSLACIFGILSIPLIYLLGKEVSRRCVGTLAALVYAVSALHIYYSQEGRQYAFLTFVVMGSFLCYAKLLNFYLGQRREAPRKITWVLYFLFNFAGIYTHYYVFLGLLVQFIFLFIVRKKEFVYKYLKLHFLLFVSFIPWILVFIKQYGLLQLEGEKLMSRFSPLFSIPFIMAKLAVFGNENFIREHLGFYLISFLVFGASFLLGSIYFYRDNNKVTILLLMTLFVPIVIVYLLSLLGFAIYSSHPFMMFSFPLYLLIARVVTERKILNYLLFAAVILLNLFVLFRLNWSQDYTKPKVKEVFEYIEQKGGPEDLVGKIPRFLPGEDAYDVWVWQYYNKGRRRMLDLSGSSEKVISQKILNALEAGGRIWVGFSIGRGNEDTLPGVTELLRNELKELDRKIFSSKIRGNSIALIYYEKTQRGKKGVSD